MEEEIVGVVMDVRNMKKVIEGVKRADLNHRLPRGCALFQEVDTRFHSVHDVAARFINALPYIRKLIDDGLAPESVNTAMGEIKVVDMMRTEDSQSLSAPRLLALVQVFKPVVEAMVKLQASQSPTLHLVLPLLTHIISKLFFIQRQSQEQVKGNEEAHSSCIQAMAAHLARVLLDKVVLHPVHAAAAILHPNLRDLSSFSRLGQRRMTELRVRALGVLDLSMRDTPTGKDLAEKSQEAAAVSSALVREPAAAPGTSSTFSLVNCFDLSTAPDERSPWNPRDEIERYLQYTLGREDKTMLQSDDPFAIVNFWIRQKGRFPCLYEAALHILAIPASQCLPERAFSAADNAQPTTRDSMLPSTLSDIIYLRSKTECEEKERSSCPLK
jgi:hAT family C-terminal dimerisation region